MQEIKRAYFWRFVPCRTCGVDVSISSKFDKCRECRAVVCNYCGRKFVKNVIGKLGCGKCRALGKTPRLVSNLVTP